MKKPLISDGTVIVPPADPLTVECPNCKMPRGHRCINYKGGNKAPCAERYRLAQGLPPRDKAKAGGRPVQRDLFSAAEGGEA